MIKHARLLSSRKVLFSTCLLLILASSLMVPTSGQETFAVTICPDLENDRIQVFINGAPFCIILNQITITINGGYLVEFNGEVYEGECDNLGESIGSITGNLTLAGPAVILIFTITTPEFILHSESMFKGSFENLVSCYAFVKIDGTTIPLNLIGIDTSTEPECYPTFIFELGFASQVSAEATDSVGNVRSGFLTTESVYATGSGFPPGIPVDIYVVNDRAWTLGDEIPPDISSDGINTATTDGSGNLGPVLIWPSPLTIGSYDVVFDADQCRIYYLSDAVDHPNHPGFTVSRLDPGSSVVGGFYVPADRLALLASYITLVSLIGIVTSVLLTRKRRKN